MKKIRYKGKFDLNYIGPSQIVVQIIGTNQQAVIRSQQAEISKVDIKKDRYVIAKTHETLITADLATGKSSEIPWRGSGNEKYDFSNENICMVFNAGELTLVEYGNNQVLGTCRTEHMKNALISAKISYDTINTKVIAFLLDLQTLQIQDLNTQGIIATIAHDAKIDFLELNSHANRLIFRDKRRQLYLYNIKAGLKHTLLSFCSYAQWVPESEVIVAQNRNNLCVWYSIENPDKVTLYPIKGDVDTIERIPSTPDQVGSTSVIVSEGQNKVAYKLDEPLIEFGFAVESRDLEKAAQILDRLELTPDSEANWKVLAQLSLEQQNLSVSEHCYAALGDMARAAYLRKVNKLKLKYEQETGRKDGLTYYKVQQKLAVLDKQFNKAEQLLLDHNEIDEAMEMYQDLHKWDESIKIAERRGHPQIKELKENYYSWLIDTGQEEKAAELKEVEGDFLQSIELYLRGGLPAKAANIVFNCNMSFPQNLLEKIAQQLSSAGMFDKAGEFYEQMENDQMALKQYVQGNAFKKAVDLAKRKEPKLVKQLEESWATFLVENKETESAINHFVEAGKYQKAIEAAVQSRQWTKAIQLLQNQTPELSRPFYKMIAKHYEDVRQYDFAEKYYLKANSAVEGFEMYVKASKWEKALQVARENLPEEEIVQLYLKQGRKMEQLQKYKEAEKLYLTVQEYDQAIGMYQNLSQYESVIRLASKHTPNKLKDTHLQIAKKLEKENSFKKAEQHFIEAGSWHLAMQMYKTHGQWEEAIRCCRLYGSEKETCQQAKLWAESLGPEQGLKMLLRMNLVDALIEYQSDRNEFDEAFKLANQNAKHKLQDVHYKYACHLEDERRYKEAEEHFVKAGKPSEAINMYEHLGDFTSALQVAKQYEPSSVQSIQISQAKFFIEKKDIAKAELAFIQAKKPELAIKMYVDMDNFPKAIQISKSHAPHLFSELQNKYMNKANTYTMSGEELYQSAQTWEDQRDYLKAVEIYLEVTPQNTQDEEVMQRAWERAVQISQNYDKDKYPRIVQMVCRRLIEIKKHETAAYLYEQVGQYQDAIQTYVAAKEFGKAKQVAQQINQKDLHQKLMDYIVQQQKIHAEQSGHASGMIEVGDVSGALEMLAQKNEWNQCLQLADKHGTEYLNKYLMRFIKISIPQGRFTEAIQAFATYGMPTIQANYTIYKNLTIEIFVDCDPKELKLLRQALFGLVEGLQATNEIKTEMGKEFYKYLTVSHLLNLRNQYLQDGIHKLYTQVCIALVRYCDLVRVDQLYLDAGRAARKQNQLGLAFVFLNRYFDINEAIDDPDNNNLGEGQEFNNTDIPSPYDVPLPEKNLIAEAEKDEIKDWLLQMSVSQQQQQTLPIRLCDCGFQIYEAALKCVKCKTTSEPCIITGYPLLKEKTIQCQSCGKGGLKEAWQIYSQAYSTCPWCNKHPRD